MITRRQALLSAAVVPLIRLPRPKPAIEIISENTSLSTESAAGYRLSSGLAVARPVLVLAGVRELSAPTQSRVNKALANGAFVVLEYDPYAARGKQVTPARYIQYTWPRPLMIRSFGPVRALKSGPGECIAHSSGMPVAMRHKNLLSLSAMLGPHLFAGDRQAHELWNSLLVRCAGRSSGGTSTTA